MRFRVACAATRYLAMTMPLTLLLVAGPARAAGPFVGFVGHWSGSGNITMTDGSGETIRCKADYSPSSGAQSLSIRVDCASDSYKVLLSADVVAQGTAFSGSWQEATRQVQGNITGRVPAPGELQASLEGLGFGIQLAATTSGKLQAVKIVSQGTDVQGVTIKLHKR